MPRELTLQQRQFVASYLGGATATQAAIDAGYSRHSAKSRGHLLTRNKLVRAEVDRVRNTLAKDAEFTLAAAMREAETSMAFAVETNNASAHITAVKHRAQLAGLLETKLKIDVTQPVDLAGALAEAKARADLRLPCDSARTIEGQFVALPAFAAHRPIDQDSTVPLKTRTVSKETERAVWHDLKPSFNPNDLR